MKKSIMMMPLLFTAVLGTVFFGRRYALAQSEELAEKQVTVSQHDDETEENTAGMAPADGENISAENNPNELLTHYETNSANLSLYEYLDFMSLKNGKVTLAYYGDIDTEEAWINEVTDRIQDSVSGTVSVIDHSYPGYDSYELYIEQTPQAVLDEAPDVILYALPALPDQQRDMGLTETEEFMGYVLDRLLTLEDMKLFMLEPYPVPEQISQLNSRSLDYRSYLGRMQTVSEAYGVPLIPLHAEFTAKSTEGSLDYYFDESAELNEAGNQQVISLLDKLFSEEM
ncbi:hypothetical protein SAMN04488102_12210 [Alkalibacterium subtropicum]|uniref:SGNH/GDSL hydrolase family protein n=1 Tax=Alkalibacterium subtropicum TaxID=753702 RepID=A0A1I1LH32_9LACT|nr:SGNH/GDSL hydrolase family protein [Alkalibacterium subtropicum]SFC72487.1 hypothetical protein SAMN04488102_12210 [Alkalibacterium subtropicum]